MSSPDGPKETYFNERELKIFLETFGIAISLSTIRAWRERNRKNLGPPFSRIGKKIRYRRSDITAWLEASRVNG